MCGVSITYLTPNLIAKNSTITHKDQETLAWGKSLDASADRMAESRHRRVVEQARREGSLVDQV